MGFSVAHTTSPDGPAPLDIAAKLLAYCQSHDWAGYDPYDALNSRVFRASPFFRSKWARLAFTQAMKRSPVNLRPLMGVPPSSNPKGIALFLSALVKLSKAGVISERPLIPDLTERLLALRTPDQTYSCWGYNFDWQTRTLLVPRGSPNIICTTFAGEALLDAYEAVGEPRYLAVATDASGFLFESLYVEAGADSRFRYTPWEDTRVHNANLLGAAYIARLVRLTGQSGGLDRALRATRYSVRCQHDDGSWDYGERDAPSQRWKDGFHTGYNLCALLRLSRDAATDEFDACIAQGYRYYLDHFFEVDGAPKYYHDRVYPLDIHSAAQAMITLVSLNGFDSRSMETARRVYAWTLAHMRDPRGFFYYQKGRAGTNRIPYMRWSQAWMLLALACLYDQSGGGGAGGRSPGTKAVIRER